jgi:hypothetical protein|tara:strand:+ start:444 stop:821 length:378 start_codon:yes stop_codon:yes gene_type:complete
MAQWSDSIVNSGTVASVSETQVGSTISIPNNQDWLITGLWSQHSQGGTARISIPQLSGMRGVYMINSAGGDSLSPAADGSSIWYNTNFVVRGPANIELYVSAKAATSDVAYFMVNYQVTTKGSAQ